MAPPGWGGFRRREERALGLLSCWCCHHRHHHQNVIQRAPVSLEHTLFVSDPPPPERNEPCGQGGGKATSMRPIAHMLRTGYFPPVHPRRALQGG